MAGIYLLLIGHLFFSRCQPLTVSQGHKNYSAYIGTSGFWARVRARALRPPVFLASLTRQTGRCAPPPSQLRYFLFDPQKYWQSIELGPPTSSLSTGPQRLWNMRSPAPAPPIAASLILLVIWGKRVYFYAGKTHIGHSDGFFERAKPFFALFGVTIMYRCDHTP